MLLILKSLEDETRQFNGKTYCYIESYREEEEAKNAARKARAQGFLVEVVVEDLVNLYARHTGMDME